MHNASCLLLGENNLVCLLVIISTSLVMLYSVFRLQHCTDRVFVSYYLSNYSAVDVCVRHQSIEWHSNNDDMMWNVRRTEWLHLQNWARNGVNVQWRLKASNWGVWLKQSVAVQLRFEYFVMTCCWCCKRTVKLFQAPFRLILSGSNEKSKKTNSNPSIPSARSAHK